MLQWKLLIPAVTFTLLVISHESHPCNEAVCGSIVSKCLLTQSCKCDFKKDCSCCKDCAYCLSFLFNECCSCVDMCPKPNETRTALNKQSQVQDYSEPIADLFKVLTDEPDPEKRWTVFVFPVDGDKSHAPKVEIKYQLQSVEQEVISIKPNATTLNCTVAFMSHCMSGDKCRQSCQSMGASSMRWFHNGCCECVGQYCRDYGLNDSRCLHCSNAIDNELDGIPDDELEYGDDEMDEYLDEED